MCWKKVPCFWFEWVSNLKTLWRTLQRRVEYITAMVADKEGICVKKFVIKLGEFPSEPVLCSSIGGNISQAEELRSHRLTIPIQSHLIREWVMREDAKWYANHMALKLSDPMVKVYHLQSIQITLKCHKC